MMTIVRSPLRLRQVMRAMPASKMYAESAELPSSKIMLPLPRQLTVSAPASLCICSRVSQEMFLRALKLRSVDAAAVLIPQV